jgi:hypothetical protein
LYVTKPGKPVIIVYSNPNAWVSLFYGFLRKVKRALIKPAKKMNQEDDLSLYFHPHHIGWWNRFNDIASVKILPWRSFGSDTQKRLIPNNKLGKKMFNMLFNLEERFPDFFVKHFQYPMIILTKGKV